MSGKILIVDAVAANRILLRGKLAAACYRPIQAESGRAALRRARDDAPDIVLVDLDLPDIDAISLCRQLRRDPATRMIPVVVLGSCEDRDARLRALAAGADDVLYRPLDEAQLLARIRGLMRAREVEAELTLREMTGRELGFSEAAAPFDEGALVALVAGAPAEAMRWRASLGRECEHRILIPRRAQSVFVIAADLAARDDGLRLMSTLRSRSRTRHAAMCILLPEGQNGRAAMALDLGAADVVQMPFDPKEMALRLDTLVRRKRQGDRLRTSLQDGVRQSVRDPLTGLHNRRYALPHLVGVSERAAKSGRTYAVMLLDIDRFKVVNDKWGHAAGDTVLQEIAERLGNDLRSIDLLARIGGEEFLAVLPDMRLAHAQSVAERLCHAVEESPITLSSGAKIRVTLSIGLAIANGTETVETVMEHADQALRRAKSEGRNQVTVHHMTAA